MLRQLNDINPWLLALLVVGAAEIYSTGLMLLCRRFWGTERLSLNNEVAGFKFAVVGVFYAVLLAFVVIAVWEDYRDTEASIRNEAKALVDLQQIADAMPSWKSADINGGVAAYGNAVRNSEWQAMASGKSSAEAESALTHLRRSILSSGPGDPTDGTLRHHALDLVTTVNDNRNDRLEKSDGSIPSALWIVLIAGGLITLGYPSFFGTVNLGAQILMTAALAALVALTLFVAILLDFPFAGSVALTPAAFEQVLVPTHGP
jgi:hypothetical protein